MGDLQFSFTEVKAKALRRSRKGSKYDPVIDSFRSGGSDLVKVEIPGLTADYVRFQLKKRIDARELGEKMGVSTIGNAVYLEKK